MKENDIKALGKMFLVMYDDIRDNAFIDALTTLLDMIVESVSETDVKKINQMLEKWYSMLPK